METGHFRVVGTVQGVGFRWFVRERARRLGLAGWVRNCRDGSVEVAASGASSSLALLQEVLRAGPPGAEVRDLEYLAADGLGELPTPFTILR
jgi:acylphosphatase